ncbi:MAG: GNAT family N-acetyltransferase [Candidatus Thorarchaeota archaeon]
MKLSSHTIIRKILDRDRTWIRDVLISSWGSTKIVSRGVIHNAEGLHGYIAEDSGNRLGLLTYDLRSSNLEIVTLNVLTSGKGIGKSLISRVIDLATSEKCKRIWVITTNDNTPAMKFYEAVGFQLFKIHKRAIEQSRKLKPEIPLIGINDVPVLDEVEYEIILKD